MGIKYRIGNNNKSYERWPAKISYPQTFKVTTQQPLHHHLHHQQHLQALKKLNQNLIQQKTHNITRENQKYLESRGLRLYR